MSTIILVTDNDSGFRDSVRQSLAIEDYDVQVAANGVEALKVLEAGEVDILITDILMPEMDGVELCTKAKALFPELRTLGMTGGGKMSCSDVIQMSSRFFDVFLKKPFGRADLMASVQQLEDSPKAQPRADA